jgi:hypothetical protein
MNTGIAIIILIVIILVFSIRKETLTSRSEFGNLILLKDKTGNYLTTTPEGRIAIPRDVNNIYQYWSVDRESVNGPSIIQSPNNALIMSIITFRMIEKAYKCQPNKNELEYLVKCQDEIGKRYKMSGNMLIGHTKLVDWKDAPYKYIKFQIDPVQVITEPISFNDYFKALYNTFYTKEEAAKLTRELYF